MKNKMHPFFKILLVLFIIYVSLFIANQTGYYEKIVRDKTIMTEEKRVQFEKDLEDNKVIDMISYLPEEEDYSNFVTKSANVINNKLSDIFSDEVHNVWDFLKSLFIG